MSKPIYDFETPNKSFIKVHNILKDKGVKNNKFHLVLNNPDLQGIDPYSEDLTEEQKQAIIEECKTNIFYYIREVVRIPVYNDVVMFRLDIASACALYLFSLNINFYLMKPSQCYKTTDVACMLSHPLVFSDDNTIMLSSRKKDNSRITSTIIGNIMSTLPEYIRQIKKSDINRIRIANHAKSEIEAEEIGRSYVGNYRYFDEFEYTEYIYSTVSKSLKTFEAESQQAWRNGRGYCTIFTSVPGRLMDDCCQDALYIIDDFAVWGLFILDLSLGVTHKYVEEHSPIYHCVYIKYGYEDIGLGEEWFNKMSKLRCADNKEYIDRELLLKRV